MIPDQDSPLERARLIHGFHTQFDFLTKPVHVASVIGSPFYQLSVQWNISECTATSPAGALGTLGQIFIGI